MSHPVHLILSPGTRIVTRLYSFPYGDTAVSPGSATEISVSAERPPWVNAQKAPNPDKH